MSVTRIANRYAKSLIDLATEQGRISNVLADVEAIQRALSNRDFYNLLKSPIVKHDKKQRIIDAIFGDKLDRLSKLFVEKLTRKGREMFIPEIIEAFIKQYKELQGITTVRLTSAVDLSEEMIDQIRTKLENSGETRKHVEIQHRIDPSIIGGYVIEFQDKLFDASVVHHLEELKREFAIGSKS